MEEYDLMQCIDKGLERLGTSARQTVYWKVSILHGSLHDAVITNPSIFIGVLHDIFRDSSVVVERFITREIANAFSLSKGESETLESAIRAANEQITPTATPGSISISNDQEVSQGLLLVNAPTVTLANRKKILPPECNTLSAPA